MPGRILEGRATLDEVGQEIFDRVLAVGRRPAHGLRAARPPGVHPHLQDRSSPIGPECLP